MTGKDLHNFSGEMSRLAAVYNENKGKEAWSVVLEIYFEGLKQFNFEDVKAAMKRYIYAQNDDSKFFPKPCSLIMICSEIAEEKAQKVKADKFLTQEKNYMDDMDDFDIAAISTCISLSFKINPKSSNVIRDQYIIKKGGWCNIRDRFHIDGKNWHEVKKIICDEMKEMEVMSDNA